VSGILSAFEGGYPANPVISGAASVNEVLTASSATAAAWQLGMVRQAATPAGGVALVNGTPNILTWTTPNDGLIHRFTVFAVVTVTVNMVGGDTDVGFTAPDGTICGHSLIGGGATVGFDGNLSPNTWLCEANTSVLVLQGSALTGGAAKIWAEIWGS
jgi:hypothetical protein